MRRCKAIAGALRSVSAAGLILAALPVGLAHSRVAPGDAVRTERFGHVISAFTSRFDASERARSHNMALAVAKISGTLLKAGEEFSFNRVVGARSAEAGFLPAPVLTPLGKEVAIGGGVCQVASTLYNAALLADLEITWREPHSSVVSYVEAGRDATVAEFKDLRFRNPHGESVVIKGEVRLGRLIFRFVSSADLPYAVRIETETSDLRPQEQDRRNSRLPEGVKSSGGTRGVSVRVYRVLSRDGVDSQRELVSEDVYAPGHVIRGSG